MSDPKIERVWTAQEIDEAIEYEWSYELREYLAKCTQVFILARECNERIDATSAMLWPELTEDKEWARRTLIHLLHPPNDT